MNQLEFDIKEHKHKFAVWAAGRAASVIGYRFPVKIARLLIDSINLKQYIDQPSALPEDFDDAHIEWCEKIQDVWSRLIENPNSKLSYGVAAKLINIYLKCIFVCGGHHEQDKVKKIHPPIDRVLLKALAKYNVGNQNGFWRKYAEKGWSSFNKLEYFEVIAKMEDVVRPNGLYTIEHFWIGYQ